MGIRVKSHILRPIEAIHHFRRSVKSDFKIRFFGLVRALFYSFINERYGVFKGSVAIVGSDFVLNKIIAIKLASSGVQSTIFNQTSSESDPCNLGKRKEDDFNEVLIPFFSIITDMEPDTSLGMNDNLDKAILSINSCHFSPLITVSNEARLSFHGKSADQVSFFVDFDSSIKSRGDNSLSFWGLNQKKMMEDDCEWDMYRAKFKVVIITSKSDIQEAGIENIILAGSSEKSIYEYETFRISDRFSEIKSIFNKINGLNILE